MGSADQSSLLRVGIFANALCGCWPNTVASEAGSSLNYILPTNEYGICVYDSLESTIVNFLT